jgi:hypothetical protein
MSQGYTPGPQGVDGPAGPIGPQGPAGATGVAGSTTVPFATVATLPAASANVGQLYIVTDALLPAIGAIIVGGGAVKTLVFSDGTNWRGA